MAEDSKPASTVPITKYYVPDSVKTALQSLASGPGYINDVNKMISDLESTGQISEGNRVGVDATALSSATKGVLDFADGVNAAIADYKSRESTLTSAEMQNYIALMNTANSGEVVSKSQQDAAIAQFKADIETSIIEANNPKFGYVALNPNVNIETIVNEAAQKFLVEGNPDKQKLSDFLIQKGLIPDTQHARDMYEALGNSINNYLPNRKGYLDAEISRVNTLLPTVQNREVEEARQKEQIALAESQRSQSQDIFNQSLQAFQEPLPTFTPEFSEEMLAQLQNDILSQGNLAMGSTEAAFSNRGLTGSSIEAFGLSQTGQNISDAFANATLNFLLQSGTSAQRNREFLANQLFQQSLSLLTASQQTESLVTGREQNADNLYLQQQSLQAQIDQFNKSFAESQRQYNEQYGLQKQELDQNMQLLMQQLSQPSGGSPFSSIFSGGLTGAALGGLLAVPTGGLSIAAGAGLGFLGGAGMGLGSYYGDK